MKDTKQTKLESEYQRCDKKSKILMYVLFALTIILSVFLIAIHSDDLRLMFITLIIMNTVFIVIAASKINNKRNEYLQLLNNERDLIVRQGLFKKIYDAYKYDGFEMNLTYDRLHHMDYYNNSIDIFFRYKMHEIEIEMDANGAYVVIDEETDNPIEKAISYDDIESIEDLYVTINHFVIDNTDM